MWGTCSTHPAGRGPGASVLEACPLISGQRQRPGRGRPVHRWVTSGQPLGEWKMSWAESAPNEPHDRHHRAASPPPRAQNVSIIGAWPTEVQEHPDAFFPFSPEAGDTGGRFVINAVGVKTQNNNIPRNAGRAARWSVGVEPWCCDGAQGEPGSPSSPGTASCRGARPGKVRSHVRGTAPRHSDLAPSMVSTCRSNRRRSNLRRSGTRCVQVTHVCGVLMGRRWRAGAPCSL